MQVIIAIDRNPEHLKHLEEMLIATKYKLVKVDTFVKGMELARGTPPDLIIIGLYKIDVDVINTIQFFKKNHSTKNIPVMVLLKEQLSRADIDKLFKSGVAAIEVLLPVNKFKILEKMKNLLELSKDFEDQKIITRRNHITVENPSPNLILISLKSGIKHYVLPEIKTVFTVNFFSAITNQECCIDIREIPEMTEEEILLFQKIVHLFGAKKVSVVAGKQFGKLIATDLNDKVKLFMSMEDYVSYLKALPQIK